MLDITQIEAFYPEDLKPFKRNLLREYIQYKILEIIYDSVFGDKLVFMGGIAIRMLYGNTRFSEDLDFDNLNLTKDNFCDLLEVIQKKMKLMGFSPEIKNVFTNIYRSYIRIPNVLFNYGLTNHKAEKLLIQIDIEPQKFQYQPDILILNKFDVFLRIRVVPKDILLAQKIAAIFYRKRVMGRDFYDAVFLLGQTKPNLNYLKQKLNVQDKTELQKHLLKRCENFDFDQLARDVEPFLFKPSDAKKVRMFMDYIKNYKF